MNRKAATSNRYCFFVLCSADFQHPASPQPYSSSTRFISSPLLQAMRVHLKFLQKISVRKFRHLFPTSTDDLHLRHLRCIHAIIIPLQINNGVIMKTTFPAMILGSVLALTLAACNTVPTTTGASVGGSQAGTTGSSAMASGSNENATRGAAPVNCTVTGTDASNSTAMTPGTKCPSESQ
ncbi:MAG TPA: hypothetical protein VF663_01810 [Telluria sp.]